MDQDEAVKKVAEATAAIMEGIAEALPESALREAREWEAEQATITRWRDAEARADLERFRSHRGDRQWRRH